MSPPAPVLPDEIVPAELRAVFGDPVPPEELVLWAAMAPEGRKRALARLGAVRVWDADARAGSADAIARDLGISRSRFYRMVSDWRSKPSLASLGATATTLRPRSPKAKLADAHQALQKALPRVLERHKGEKVSALVRLLRQEVEGLVPKLPGDTTIRTVGERELRRRAVLGAAGNQVVFDLCAIGVPGPGGHPHVMFACVDVATTFVLGVAVGDPGASREGYRMAAADALRRLGDGGAQLSWAPALALAQVTPGEDAAEWPGFFETAGRATGANVQAKGAGVRFGTDLRRLLGDALGRVRLLPFKAGARTPITISVANAEFTPVEAKARLEAGLAEHNAGVLAAAGSGSGSPPPGLVALLRLLAD